MMPVGVISRVLSDDTPADKAAAEFMLPFILFSPVACYTLMLGTMPRTSTFILFAVGWGVLIGAFYIQHWENRRFYFLAEQTLGEAYTDRPAESIPLSGLFLREIRITASGSIRLETSRLTLERLKRIDTILPLLLYRLLQAYRSEALSEV